MGSLYLGGPTIQEVDGKMMMGLSIYGVAVISASLYSRFYGMATGVADVRTFTWRCGSADPQIGSADPHMGAPSHGRTATGDAEVRTLQVEVLLQVEVCIF